MDTATRVDTTNTIKDPMRITDGFDDALQGSTRCPAIFDRTGLEERILK